MIKIIEIIIIVHADNCFENFHSLLKNLSNGLKMNAIINAPKNALMNGIDA